jgi:hypothetical protein
MLLSIFALIMAIIAMYMYKKFRQSENAYYELHLENNNLLNENKGLKNRINDLENYKNDVSKTVYLLDNDIKEIKNKINDNDYLNSVNDNTIIMDKKIINNILNEMPEITKHENYVNDYNENEYRENYVNEYNENEYRENYENNCENQYIENSNINTNIQEEKNEYTSEYGDINSLNYEKYKI